jgi:threonine dehydratase
VFVPIGGGGLIAGIAGFLKADRAETRIIGVQPENSAFMAASIAAGCLVDIDEKESIADAVAGGIESGSITFPLCRDLLDFIEEVPESLISRAMALVHEHHGRMVEGAGALPFAALLHSPAKWRDRTVVAVVSGGNISPERFRAIIGPA